MVFKWRIPFIRTDHLDRVVWVYWIMEVKDDNGNLLEYTNGRIEVGLLDTDVNRFTIPASKATEQDLLDFVHSRPCFDTNIKEHNEKAFAWSLSIEPELGYKYYA